MWTMGIAPATMMPSNQEDIDLPDLETEMDSDDDEEEATRLTVHACEGTRACRRGCTVK